jgi:VanZ family protein
MTVIYITSSMPGEDLPQIDIPSIDKLFHLSEYMVLGYLLIRAFMNTTKLTIARMTAFSVLVAVLYGASDEVHQRFVSDRIPDVLDLLADVAGIYIGVLLYKKKGCICRQ